MRDTGGEDERVRSSMLLDERLHGLARAVPIGEVEGNEDGLRSSPNDASGHLLGSVLPRTVVEPHSEPVLGKGDRGGRSDASTGAQVIS